MDALDASSGNIQTYHPFYGIFSVEMTSTTCIPDDAVLYIYNLIVPKPNILTHERWGVIEVIIDAYPILTCLI